MQRVSRKCKLDAFWWQRAGRIEIIYPASGNPRVTFFEQVASKVGDEPAVMRDVGELTFTITTEKLAETIPLRNPANGDLTGGNTTYAAVAQAIFSAYYKEGLGRDSA